MSDYRTTKPSIDVAIDVGGTFTDVVAADSVGGVFTAKVLSTPPRYGDAVIQGLRSCLDAMGRDIDGTAIRTLYHGMTVATNAILEGTGSTPALVTTRGFRDVLGIGSGRRPTLYDLMWSKPQPLVPRRLCFELHHRISSSGDVEIPLDPGAIDALVEQLRAEGVASVAVCLLNSYAFPDEERRIAGLLRDHCPELHVTASVDLNPEPGEYQRTSTAVVNAYVAPTVRRYLDELRGGLDDMGCRGRLFVMRSSGGLIDADDARAVPATLIESGPAAGVVAVRELAASTGISHLIAFDMGGTTAKASLIENGVAFEAESYEVGAGLNAARGFNSGAGYEVSIPSLDIAEIGAGGGSIAWIDGGGSVRVGPTSAGANPGPAAYGRGGQAPTLSDAAVVLGYFSQTAIAGGAQRIDPQLARAALETVAIPLSMDPLDLAHGMVQIATANMVQLVRSITVARGRDPRDFAMVAFGGSGPAYAASLAGALGIGTVVVPPSPGLFSAVGLLAADPQHERVAHYAERRPDDGLVRSRFASLREELLSDLERSHGSARVDVGFVYFADMRYQGQNGVLRIPVVDPASDTVDDLIDRQEAEHIRTYGHAKSRATAEIVTLRVRATVPHGRKDIFRLLADLESGMADIASKREVYFGPRHGRCSTPVTNRAALGAHDRAGPLIVEEMDATTVVPPDASVRRDAHGNLVITVEKEA